MGLAIGGVIANWIGVFIVYLNSLLNYSYNLILPYVVILALVSTVGLLIAVFKNKKIGGILIIIGSFIFLPLGIIGILGGKKVMRVDGEKVLEMRRRQLKQIDELELE